MILADNPSGHTIEVATRRYWASVPSNVRDVYVYGITFRHSQGTYQSAAFTIDGSNTTLEHNSFFNAGYNAIDVSGSDNKVLGNEISWNGGMALSAHRGTRLLWQGGQVQFNNRRAFYGQSLSDYWYGWDAGGSKIVYADRVVVKDLDVHHSGGPGLWCDIQCGDITYDGNHSHDNLWDGILIEGPVGPFTVTNNTADGNLYCGVRAVLNVNWPNAIGTITNNSVPNNGTAGVCRGYDNNQSQPTVTVSGNTP